MSNTSKAPTVAEITPNKGGLSGGTLVTIKGNYLKGANEVLFGGKGVTTFKSISDTQITVITPTSTAGAIDVAVMVNGVKSNSVSFTYKAPPTVTGLNPNTGANTGGTTVDITGSGFIETNTSVMFGQTAVTPVTFVSDTKITVPTPAGNGLVGVTVNTPYGTSTSTGADQFQYATIPLYFNVPHKVANKGVYLAIFGKIADQPYTPAGKSGIPVGSYAYFNGTDFAHTPTSGSLPLYTLFAPGSFPGTATAKITINLPLAHVRGGAIVIGVGSQPTLACASDGSVAVPTVATNSKHIFGLFEYSYLNNSAGVPTLDVDISEIDQIGFPFTVNSTPPPPYPAQDGVGTTANRATLFEQFKNYPDFASGSGQAFMSCYTDGIIDGAHYRLVAPQTILDTLEQGGPVQRVATLSTGGSLALDQKYYYVVTATSATGETVAANNYQCLTPANNQQTANLSWKAFPNATGYKVYRSTSVDGSQLVNPVFVGCSKTTTYTDNGSGHPPQTALPTNSYGYDPLSTYFTQSIADFFNYYRTNAFRITVDGTIWTGNTVDYRPSWAPRATYTALQLTGAKGPYNNQMLNVYQPFFSSNTNQNIAGVTYYPPMPTWMTGAEGTSPTEFPSQMVFGCDGVFQSGPFDPDAKRQRLTGVLKDLENKIVTALNRGIATNFTMAPDSWANFPLFLSATPQHVDNGTLSCGTYYYAMTYLDGSGHESTPSIEWQAKVQSPNNSVLLEWKPVSVVPPDTSIPAFAGFRIYRGTSPGQENLLVAAINNADQAPPITEFTDVGGDNQGGTPPFTYYASGFTSNLYAKFLHQNSSYDPTNGISIHSLVYGFPFDDQGGLSSNIGFPSGEPTSITITLKPWVDA